MLQIKKKFIKLTIRTKIVNINTNIVSKLYILCMKDVYSTALGGDVNFLFSVDWTRFRRTCSALYPSSIRGLATPWTYFLHLSLSSVILINSSTGSLVHILMLSIQAVRGLPHLRACGIVPGIISFSR